MRNRKRAFYKRRSVLVAAGLCVLSAFGLFGIYRMESAKNKQDQDQELVNWEETDSSTLSAKEEKSSPAPTKNDSSPKLVDKDVMDGQKERLQDGNTTSDVQPSAAAAVPQQGVELDEPEAAAEEPVVDTAENNAVASEEQTTQASVQNAINLNYQPESGMIWPVEGNVILDYSMDKSIYFPTLNQYKYNPGIAIQSEAGTAVLSAAPGVVDSIVDTDETGLTMTVDLGNGYQAVYGQLADVTLSTGSYVEAGSQIATVAEPSIYYQVEGDNLYFQVLHDGSPVDPLDYIR